MTVALVILCIKYSLRSLEAYTAATVLYVEGKKERTLDRLIPCVGIFVHMRMYVSDYTDPFSFSVQILDLCLHPNLYTYILFCTADITSPMRQTLHAVHLFYKNLNLCFFGPNFLFHIF